MEHIKEKTGAVGIVTVRSHPTGTIDKIKALHSVGAHRLANYFLRKGIIESRRKNMVVWSANSGYDILVQFLLSGYYGSFAFPLGVQWGEIGTGSTQPANTDVALQAPTNRGPIQWVADYQFSTAQMQFYFPDSVLANQTYNEFGVWIGGTSSIGTGYLFNHALFSAPYAKVSGQDTTVEVDISFQEVTAAEFGSGGFG